MSVASGVPDPDGDPTVAGSPPGQEPEADSQAVAAEPSAGAVPTTRCPQSSRRQRWRAFVRDSPVLATVLATFAGTVAGAVVPVVIISAVHIATMPPDIAVLSSVMNAEAAAAKSGDIAALQGVYTPGAVVTDAGCQTRGAGQIWSGLSQIISRYQHLPRFLSLRHVHPLVLWQPDNSTATSAEVTAETIAEIAPSATSPNPAFISGHELWTFALSRGRWIVTSFTYNLCLPADGAG